MKHYKHSTFILVISIFFIIACESADFKATDNGNVTLSFVPTSSDVTRSGINIGDYFSRLALQVFDADGNKVFLQVRTQKLADDDFGTVNCQLAPGTYTVIAVGHSSPVTPTIKSPDIVQFTAKDGVKNSDAFCYCGSVTIGDSGGAHELTMNRVTAMLRFRFTDADIPDTFHKLKVEYSGGSANFNPTTSQGCTKSNQSELLNRAAEYAVFTFPYLDKSSKLKVTLTALDADGSIIAQKTLTDVPVTRNRISTYTGTLFDASQGTVSETGFGITINDEWAGEDFYQFSRFSFNVCGDFTLSTYDMTTRSLEADSKPMTDLWLFDYIGTTLMQSLHQTSSDADFGTPTVELLSGDHHIYFVASRGKTPVISTTNHTITWSSVSDTFWKDYSLTVTGSANASRSVTLDRVVTRLRLSITDAIADDVSTISITPSHWSYGLDYITSQPITPESSHPVVIDIPGSYIGTTNLAINIFGFSSSDEWTTDIAISANSTTSVLGSASISDAPFKRNRTTEYCGPLFGSSGVMTVNLTTDWLDSHQATW